MIEDLGSKPQFMEAFREVAVRKSMHGAAIQLDIWYLGQWWDLTHNLPDYCTWLVETGRATASETHLFLQQPLAHPAMLYEAIEQLCHLLDATRS